MREGDKYDISFLAFFHSTLLLGAEIRGARDSSDMKLCSRIRELEAMEKMNKDSQKEHVPPELAKHLAGFMAQTRPYSGSWLSFFEILTSKHTYSGSIHDIDGLKVRQL